MRGPGSSHQGTCMKPAKHKLWADLGEPARLSKVEIQVKVFPRIGSQWEWEHSRPRLLAHYSGRKQGGNDWTGKFWTHLCIQWRKTALCSLVLSKSATARSNLPQGLSLHYSYAKRFLMDCGHMGPQPSSLTRNALSLRRRNMWGRHWAASTEAAKGSSSPPRAFPPYLT